MRIHLIETLLVCSILTACSTFAEALLIEREVEAATEAAEKIYLEEIGPQVETKTKI